MISLGLKLRSQLKYSPFVLTALPSIESKISPGNNPDFSAGLLEDISRITTPF